MFRDLRQLDDTTIVDTDICIVGAGAAGISLALALAGSQRRVCLVESGGLEPEPETLALNKGRSIGLPYIPLDESRLRYFGGTTNHWNSYCRPLDAIDFEKRAWVPHSGWPLTRDELEPFYARAQALCELGPYIHDDDAVSRVPGLLPFDARRLVTVNWTIGPPTRFGLRYLEDLQTAANVDVLLNANLVEIVATNDVRRVAVLRLRTLDGKSGIIHPKVVVLACGGIENARLLLASNGVAKQGLGNERDLVGRFFADHVGAIMGYVVPRDGGSCQLAYSLPASVQLEREEATLRLAPALPADLQRREQLLNAHAMMECADEQSRGYLALRAAGKGLARGDLGGLGGAIATVLGDLDGTAGALWRYVTDELVFGVSTYCETAPNPDSRITLDTERDRLGQQQVCLDWRLSPIDKRTSRHLCRILGEELARLGFGRLHMDDWILRDDESWEDHHPRDHHMGTTRMGTDPSTGVVDPNCRVHGMANLYIAGSSVFPTYGAAPPTLTIVALALRLADHLRTIDFGSLSTR
ncbi:MAG: GMC family oxidoreductase [Enhydrobacter sp.]|nr:MAG: GMC family oxidoreductase [Enhydrobacter sp.]